MNYHQPSKLIILSNIFCLLLFTFWFLLGFFWLCCLFFRGFFGFLLLFFSRLWFCLQGEILVLCVFCLFYHVFILVDSIFIDVRIFHSFEDLVNFTISLVHSVFKILNLLISNPLFSLLNFLRQIQMLFNDFQGLVLDVTSFIILNYSSLDSVKWLIKFVVLFFVILGVFAWWLVVPFFFFFG